MVPGRGLCKIKDLKIETILDQQIGLAILEPRRGNDLLKIPIDQLEKRGVRELATEEELDNVMENLGEIQDLRETDPVERIARWTELLHEGDYGCRLLVLKEIALVEKAAELNPREKKFKQRIRMAARREIESILGTSASNAGRRLNEMLGVTS